MRPRAALAAVLLLASCAPPEPPPSGGARLLSADAAAHGHSISPDGKRAAWVHGDWPDRTQLVQLDVATGRRETARFEGYSLVETAFDTAGGLKVLARKLGFSESPYNPPTKAAVLTVSETGRLLLAKEDPAGRILDRKPVPWHQGVEPTAYTAQDTPTLVMRGPGETLWVASAAKDGSRFAVESFEEGSGRRLSLAAMPGPVESLLPLDDALYVLTLSSESLRGARRGPRLLTKIDLRSGRPSWSSDWAPRPSALLARSPDGRLFAAVRDPAAPSLWSFEDEPKAAAAAGAAAAAPGAGRFRGLRIAAMFLGRILPALLLAFLFFSFRR